MSGGRFNYIDSQLKSEIFGWRDVCINAFEDMEISELVFDVLDLIHSYDWYKSGDTDEDDYLKDKAKFKEKWFKKSRKETIKRIVDKTFEETKEKLYKTFDIENNEKEE